MAIFSAHFLAAVIRVSITFHARWYAIFDAAFSPAALCFPFCLSLVLSVRPNGFLLSGNTRTAEGVLSARSDA